MGLFNFLFGKLIDKRIAKYQNNLIDQQCIEVENMYRTMRGWRHDYHNHIQTMKAYLKMNKLDELDEYLNKLDTDLTTVDTVIKTGNLMIDAILNSKLSIFKANNISVNAKAIVPKTLKVNDIDLCVIIGNLLDNALEACLKIDKIEDRFLRVYIDIFKGQLYISVQNSNGGKIKKIGKTYYTSKDGNTHGFGILRIDNIVNKYNGFINRQHEEGVFATEVMLPL